MVVASGKLVEKVTGIFEVASCRYRVAGNDGRVGNWERMATIGL